MQTEILGENQEKAFPYGKWNPHLHIFSHRKIGFFFTSYYRFFLGCVEGFVAVEISGGMNDFAIWKGHLYAACPPDK